MIVYIDIIIGILIVFFGIFLGNQYDNLKSYTTKLKQNRMELESLLNNDKSFIWYADFKNLKSTVSKGIESIYGYEARQFEENIYLWRESVHPQDKQLFNHFLDNILKGHQVSGRWRILRSNSEIRHIESQGNPILNEYGEVVKVVGVVYDVTEQLQQFNEIETLNIELIKSKRELQNIFDHVHVALFSVDYPSYKLFCSKGMEVLLGVKRQYFLDSPRSWSTFVHPDDKEMVFEKVKELLNGHKVSLECRIILFNGEVKWVEAFINPYLNKNGDLVKLYGVLNDITQRKLIENKVEYMAFYDTLTGLPNRYMVVKEIFKKMNHCEKARTNLAVIFLDLDNFKLINDTKGHNVGDTLLQEVARRLMKSLHNRGMVARQGGDEFIIVLENAKEKEVTNIAEKVLDVLKQPFHLEDVEFFISASIGISIYPKDGKQAETLIKNADQAMYHAKERGKNNYQFFIPESEEKLKRNMKLKNDIKRAIKNEEFYLLYQPQIEFSTGEWRGVEALIRWSHPELGTVSPSEFIPIAENTGYIINIGEWVIDKACQQMTFWREREIFPEVVAVNVSALQFQNGNFLENIKKILRKYNLPPSLLELEITESVMQDVKESTEVLRELKQLGVKISIDDFGTGFSSLNVLHRLPMDYVKIDKSFIDDIFETSNIEWVIKTLIQLSENLKFDLIAEGIEDIKQADFLKENKCRYGQGYLFSKPIPSEKVADLLKNKWKYSDNEEV